MANNKRLITVVEHKYTVLNTGSADFSLDNLNYHNGHYNKQNKKKGWKLLRQK